MHKHAAHADDWARHQGGHPADDRGDMPAPYTMAPRESRPGARHPADATLQRPASMPLERALALRKSIEAAAQAGSWQQQLLQNEIERVAQNHPHQAELMLKSATESLRLNQITSIRQQINAAHERRQKGNIDSKCRILERNGLKLYVCLTCNKEVVGSVTGRFCCHAQLEQESDGPTESPRCVSGLVVVVSPPLFDLFPGLRNRGTDVETSTSTTEPIRTRSHTNAGRIRTARSGLATRPRESAMSVSMI